MYLSDQLPAEYMHCGLRCFWDMRRDRTRSQLNEIAAGVTKYIIRKVLYVQCLNHCLRVVHTGQDQPVTICQSHISEPFLATVQCFLSTLLTCPFGCVRYPTALSTDLCYRTDLIKTYLDVFILLFLLHIYFCMYVQYISLYVLFCLVRCNVRFIPTGMRRQPLLRTSCAASIERFTLSCYLSLVSFLPYAS